MKTVSLNAYAKITGLLYLIIAIIGGFSIGYLPSMIFVKSDPIATAENIRENMSLFRWMISGDIIVLVLEVILTVMLYALFRKLNKTLTLIASFTRLAMSIIMGINLLNYLLPVLLLSDSVYLNTFEIEQLESLSLLFLEAHKFGEYIWQLFFGLHLIVLGYLVFQSKYFPKLIGILMMIGSIGYAGDSLSKLLFVENESSTVVLAIFLTIAVIGELSFTFWLLIKGVDIKKWKAQKGVCFTP